MPQKPLARALRRIWSQATQKPAHALPSAGCLLLGRAPPAIVWGRRITYPLDPMVDHRFPHQNCNFAVHLGWTWLDNPFLPGRGLMEAVAPLGSMTFPGAWTRWLMAPVFSASSCLSLDQDFQVIAAFRVEKNVVKITWNRETLILRLSQTHIQRSNTSRTWEDTWSWSNGIRKQMQRWATAAFNFFFQRAKREPERSVGFILIHLVSCHIWSLPCSLETSVILLALLRRRSEGEPRRIKDSHMTQTRYIWT